MKEFIQKIFKKTNLEIPKPVKQNFNRNFKKAKNEEWSQKGQNWEALFYLDKRESIAIFDQEGNLVEKRTNISVDGLPEQILNIALALGEIMNVISISGYKGKGYEIILRDKEFIRYLVLISEDGKIVSHAKL